MTPHHQRRIEVAKKREREADAALSRAYEKQRAEREALTRKQQPRARAAEEKVRQARAATSERVGRSAQVSDRGQEMETMTTIYCEKCFRWTRHYVGTSATACICGACGGFTASNPVRRDRCTNTRRAASTTL